MKDIEKKRQVDTSSSISLVVFNDLEILSNLIDEFENKKTNYEILFGFQNFDEDSLESLKSFQSKNQFLHCYGFNSDVDDVLVILQSLCLYDKILTYPQDQIIRKKSQMDNNFDFSCFYSLKKINLGILTCSWKRPKLTSKYCEHLDFLKKKFTNHVNVKSIIIDSDQINESTIKKSQSLYFKYPNQPLSNKFNFGMSHFKDKKIDYVMVLGSDNFVDETLFIEFIKIMRNNIDLIGVLNSYVYDLKSKKTYHFLGYPKKNKRYGETLGAGRILSQNILSSLDYQPWKNGLSKGLDGSMWQKLYSLNFTEYKINVKKIGGMMLGVKTSTFITDINKMVNKVEVPNDILEKMNCIKNF